MRHVSTGAAPGWAVQQRGPRQRSRTVALLGTRGGAAALDVDSDDAEAADEDEAEREAGDDESDDDEEDEETRAAVKALLLAETAMDKALRAAQAVGRVAGEVHQVCASSLPRPVQSPGPGLG